MTEDKAADLPEGSVVANGRFAVFRELSGVGMVWYGSNGRRYDDQDMNELLVGAAVVLRHGYGDEEKT